MDRVITIGGVVIGILALIVVAVIITNFAFSYFHSSDVSLQASINSQANEETLPEGKVKVPSVVGMSQDDAKETLNDNHLGYDVVAWEYSDDYSYGQIISQDATPGTIVDAGTITVNLVASYGSEKIQVPNGLDGENISDAIEKIEDMGLEWEVTYEYSAKPIDTIIEYSPNGKAEVSRGDVIKLKVSRGSQSSGETIGTIPDVTGKKLDKAQEAIESAGFKSGTPKKIYSDDVKKNVVIRQSIKSGRAPYGTTIYLIVSMGPEKVAKQYNAQYTIALEDLLDEEGEPITSGTVTAVLNGVPFEIDEKYSRVENWDGDYTMNLTGEEKGTATLYIYVDGVEAFQTTVKLK